MKIETIIIAVKLEMRKSEKRGFRAGKRHSKNIEHRSNSFKSKIKQEIISGNDYFYDKFLLIAILF